MIEPITASEAAKRLGVSRQYIHKMIRQGRLDAQRGGFCWMVEGMGLVIEPALRPPTRPLKVKGAPKGKYTRRARKEEAPSD